MRLLSQENDDPLYCIRRREIAIRRSFPEIVPGSIDKPPARRSSINTLFTPRASCPSLRTSSQVGKSNPGRTQSRLSPLPVRSKEALSNPIQLNPIPIEETHYEPSRSNYCRNQFPQRYGS